MATLTNAWFADHAPGKGRTILVAEGTAGVTNIVGHGNGWVPYTLAPPGDTIPVDGSTSPVGGMTFAQIMGVFENATGFDGYEYLSGMPAHTNSKNLSLSCWVDCGVTTVPGWVPAPNQGALLEGYSSADSSGAARYGVYLNITQDPPTFSLAWNGPTTVVQGGSYNGGDVTYPGDGTTNAGWVHLMVAIQVNADGSAVRSVIYVNDTEIVDSSNTAAAGTFTALPLSENTPQTTSAAKIVVKNIGGRQNPGSDPNKAPYQTSPDSGEGLSAALAEFALYEGQFIDWAIAANRAKFHVTSLALNYYAPCDIGTKGQTPTGTKASVYLRGGPAQFILNAAAGNSALTKNVVGIHDLLAVDDPPAPPV